MPPPEIQDMHEVKGGIGPTPDVPVEVHQGGMAMPPQELRLATPHAQKQSQPFHRKRAK
jgi:hypothetical protein